MAWHTSAGRNSSGSSPASFRQSGRYTRCQVTASTPKPEGAKRKVKTKRTDDGLPVHSFRTLLADLGTIARNLVSFGKAGEFTVTTRPTAIQQRALDLLGVKI